MSEQMKYAHIVRAIGETPWAILPAKLAVILDLVAYRAGGGKLSQEEVQARMDAARRDERRSGSGREGVAVLPLLGTIVQRANLMSEMSGGTSAERFRSRFREALNDNQVGAIVLDVDSPGGSVFGVPELAAEIREARGDKPIVAVANSLAASAAYWVASAADELVVTPSGEVGSIGVFAAHEDLSAALEDAGIDVTLISAGKYKVEGNPYEPLGEEARAAIQARVDDYYAMFVDDVARQRGVSSRDVRNGFGQGRVVGAQDAVALGMADEVATLDETIERLARRENRRGQGTSGASLDFRKRRLRVLSHS